MKCLLPYLFLFFTISASIFDLSAKEIDKEILIGTIPFITTWKTDNPGASPDNQITIPTYGPETYNYTVDWGDGTSDTAVTGDITHIYAASGTYQVSILGEFPRIFFDNSSGDRAKIIDINQWGSNTWSSMENAFMGCRFLDVSATDIPDFSLTSSLSHMFNECNELIGNRTIGDWNVRTIMDMSGMFLAARKFNQDIGSWDVSYVKNMAAMLGADSFNQNIGDWDVGNVLKMDAMFVGAESFNQFIGDWDVSSVTDMRVMFEGATSFNQDISNWNVAQVTAMNFMFSNANSFDQDLRRWNVEQVGNFNFMFDGTALSVENYDSLLNGWSQLSLQKGLRFDAGNSLYCLGEEARQKIIDSFDWTINDAGKGIDCPTLLPFMTTWKTDNPGVSADNQITIPTYGPETYNYTVDWGDGTSDTGITGDITHTYANAGTYQVSISGIFPRIYFDELINNLFNEKDSDKIVSIDQWGTNNWSSMNAAFVGCNNLDVLALDSPNLAAANSLFEMFAQCTSLKGTTAFNDWDVSNITSIGGMFSGASSFDEYIGDWDVSKVTDMQDMFNGATIFNHDLSNWNVSNVTDMSGLFNSAKAFNQDLSSWNVSSVTDMGAMFSSASLFDRPLGNWDVSQVSNMDSMFGFATVFNQDLSNWNVSNVTNMRGMFGSAEAFNSPIGSWDVGNVTDMSSMFSNALSFNTYIGNWVVSNVVEMYFMFSGAKSFNQDISNWDVGNVVSMDYMFPFATSFNQPIGAWNVSKVQYMDEMFAGATSFDQPLGDWDVANVSRFDGTFRNSGLSVENYDQTLMGWSQLPSLQNDLLFDAGTSQYCQGEDARQNIMDTYGWIINDSGKSSDCPTLLPFITTWKTDNPGVSADNQITIPTYGPETYNYTVDWGDGTSDTTVTGDITHTYATAGTYQISISGDFPYIYFQSQTDKEKIVSIDQWGDIVWNSFGNAFSDCTNLDVKANDIPNLSNVTTMVAMFSSCTSLVGNSSFNNWQMSTIENINGMFANANLFNQPLDKWDVSNVTNIAGTFSGATSFNQPIGNWNLGKVNSMWATFLGATAFNQDIGNWDVSNVDDMTGTFLGATSFNQDIGAWDVSKVTYMYDMFSGAISFDQNLENWNVSNLEHAENMFYNAKLSTYNYDALLIGWNAQNLLQNITFDGGNSTYCAGEAARASMMANNGWTITDGGFTGIQLDDLADQTHMDSYTLPKITGTNLTGNEMYFTGPNGTGTGYTAGTIINYADFQNYPVTIYIYDFSEGGTSSCTDQEDFLLTLSSSCTTPLVDGPADISVCTSYILPPLSDNNAYYTASNAGGKELRVGDAISSSQTIYVYTGSGDCYDEHNFTVTIDSSLCEEAISSCTIEFPQFITPNGDNINDTFKATKSSCEITGLLSVHDRYGRTLFMTNTTGNGWDGTYEGNLLPETDYWYRFVDSDSGEVLMGHFSLIR